MHFTFTKKYLKIVNIRLWKQFIDGFVFCISFQVNKNLRIKVNIIDIKYTIDINGDIKFKDTLCKSSIVLKT